MLTVALLANLWDGHPSQRFASLQTLRYDESERDEEGVPKFFWGGL